MIIALRIEAGNVILIDIKIWRNAWHVGCKPVKQSSWGIDVIFPLTVTAWQSIPVHPPENEIIPSAHQQSPFDQYQQHPPSPAAPRRHHRAHELQLFNFQSKKSSAPNL